MRSVDPQDPAVTYAAVLDALPIVAYMARPDGSISYVSSGYERLTGNAVAELVANGYASIIYSDDLASVGARWRLALESGAAYEHDFRIRFADGAYRWITSRADPLVRYGSVIGWFGTLTDVDARKRAETALSQSESTYRAFSAAIPGVTWAATPTGELTLVSEAWSALHGRKSDEPLGTGWIEGVHPEDRARVLKVWAHALETGEPYDVQFRVRVRDDSYHWFLVRALPVRDDAGAIVHWAGVNVDIDRERRADQSREQFVRLIESSNDFIAITDIDGNPTYVNEAGRRKLQIGSLEDAKAHRLVEYFVPEARARVENEIMPAVERDGRWSGEVLLRDFHSGEPIPFAYNIFSLLDDDGKLSGFATINHDLRESYRVEAGLRVLADTGAAMFRSLDFAETLRNVANAVTRDFATYCVFDLLDERGRLASVASIHTDPALDAALQRTVQKRKLGGGRHFVEHAAFAGESTLIAELRSDFVRDINDVSAEDFAALAPRSVICVPLRAGTADAPIGAMTLVTDARTLRGGFTERDLRFAEEVALRAGIAFEHAKAYERERRIAVTLQSASLPATLPAIAGIRLSAEYRGGNSEATIGGDWYDAFPLDDGRLVITIGDVMGNGLAAAVTMGKLRQAMQSVALVSGDLQLMLDAADRTVRSISSDSYATALAAIYDPVARTLSIASAGHPGPTVRAPDGTIAHVPLAGMLLGLHDEGRGDTRTIDLAPGSMVVFFTDGLTESTHDAIHGQRMVDAAISERAVRDDVNPARAIVDRVLGSNVAVDDIAVFVATVV